MVFHLTIRCTDTIFCSQMNNSVKQCFRNNMMFIICVMYHDFNIVLIT